MACAAVLQAGQADSASNKGAYSVIWGALIGAFFKFSGSFLGVLHETVETAAIVGSRVFYYGANISPALFSIGYIARLNIAILILIGGGISWVIALPLLSYGEHDAPALTKALSLWSSKVRYIGVGAMVVGGASSVWRVRRALWRAVQETKNKANLKSDHTGQHEESNCGVLRDIDLSGNSIIVLSSLAVITIAGIYYSLTGNAVIALAATVIMTAMAFFFSAVASYIVGLVGNSNSPVSGMTITAVLCTGGLLYVFGFSGSEGIAATLGVAAIVCCAACTAGDVCNDLKTGSLVGATPRSQQIMQIVGVFVAALVMAPILQILHENTPDGIGGRELPAPQASLFASLANGFFGDNSLPWDLVYIGVGIGLAIRAIDFMLERANTKFRMHLMPIAVGMYLPFGLATPILLGGIAAHLTTRRAKATSDQEIEHATRTGILASSGMIAGESLTGVGLALLTSLGAGSITAIMGNRDVFPTFAHGSSPLISCACGIFLVILFMYLTRPSHRRRNDVDVE